MSKWFSQNVNLSIVISLMGALIGGVAVAAVYKSDVDRLKAQMENLPSDISSMKATQEAQGKDITFIKNFMLERLR